MNNVIDAPAEVAAQSAQAGGALMAQQAQGAIQGAAPAMPQQPLSVIEQAIRTGATADQLERLLQLQVQADHHRLDLMREQRRMAEEDRKREAALAFSRDLAAFRGENIVIPKSKYVDRGKAGSFMQAEYGAAAKLLSPALSKWGFSFRHDMSFGSKRWMNDGVESDVPWVYVTCYLQHRDGHQEKLDLEGPPGDLHANTPVQNMQATGSYLKRQSLLAITGTATEDEDDETRLRKKQQHSGGSSGEADAGPDEALLDAGRAEAMKGMKALTAWWGALTSRQRSELNSEFGALRKCATQTDRGAGSDGQG